MDDNETNIPTTEDAKEDNSETTSTPKQDKGKGPMVAVSVIAVIALILAGFFFVNAKNSQKAQQEQADAVQNAANEISQKVDEAQQEQSAKDAEMQAKEAEYMKLVEEQQKLIEEANQKFKDENATKTEQCQTLLVTMPPASAVTYRSDNWNKDIVKFYSDLESAQKETEQNSEEWDDFGTQKRVTEPYKNNFLANCEDLYNADKSTITPQTTSEETGANETSETTEE